MKVQQPANSKFLIFFLHTWLPLSELVSREFLVPRQEAQLPMGGHQRPSSLITFIKFLAPVGAALSLLQTKADSGSRA